MGRKSRNTYQKNLIREEISKAKGMFSVGELHNRVLLKDSRIGIATVYRFLREAKDAGGIHSYECEGKAIYSVAKKDHCHFTCKKCGKVAHFDVHSIDFIREKVDGSVSQFQISVEGLCRNCG
ncbi:MAG: transcriptional repressor [Candidatus Woesearchaeota archaeon]